MDEVVLLAGRIVTGLLAGVYLAFLLAVIPALHGLSDEVFVAVMNRISVVIVNPAFLSLFFGAPLLAAGLLQWHRGPLVIAAVALAMAALAITFAANVPLNDALAAGGPREDFERPWVHWHALRTATAVICFSLLCRVPIS